MLLGQGGPNPNGMQVLPSVLQCSLEPWPVRSLVAQKTLLKLAGVLPGLKYDL